jgi:N-acetylmuramoyl-L-alanine amidase-like protein/putative peptidoglycan binding protein
MPTAQQFLDALKARGLTVVEHPGWRTHNRNHKGPWGPLYGGMFHHTAGVFDGIVDFCYNGSADLPGPLCHGVITKDGVVHLVGWGRANHAGGGDPQVLAAVKAQSKTLPKTNEHQGSDDAVDGNPHFIGFECVNKGDGTDPWPAVQLTAMKRAAAAVADLLDRAPQTNIRHLDWSDYKSDPKGVDWAKFQADVAKLVAGDKPPAPKPEPLPTVSLKALVDAARRDPAAPQGKTTHKADVLLYERGLVKLGYLASQWADGSFGTKTKDATRAVQRHLGYSGAAADGIPGDHSATWVGLKSGLYRKGA